MAFLIGHISKWKRNNRNMNTKRDRKRARETESDSKREGERENCKNIYNINPVPGIIQIK